MLIQQSEDTVLSLCSIPLYIDDTPVLLPDYLASTVMALVKEKGVRVVFVDEMHQLCRTSRPTKRAQRNTVLMKTFRELADNLEVTIIATSCLFPVGNRRPYFRDLERAGFTYQALSDYVDTAAYLYKKDWRGRTEIIILHNRYGKRGSTLELMFDSEHCSFRDVEEDLPEIL